MERALVTTTITGADLGDQLCLGSKQLDPAKFEPVMVGAYPWQKPSQGGFWTSSYLGPYGSGWVQWGMSDAGYTGIVDECWRLTPEPTARIYRIDCYVDLERLVEAFPHEDASYSAYSTQPHWERVAERYDAVNLTDAGQWATRVTHPLNLYGWDCESTLWFNWAFVLWAPMGRQIFERLDAE